MKVEMDMDVQSVLEFMQTRITTDRLIAVGEAVGALSPVLWARYGRSEVCTMALSADAPIPQRTQDSAT